MKNVLIALLLTLPLVGYSQDCQKFKNGTFRVKGEDGKYIPDYTIIRKKNVQTETMGEHYTKAKVVWIDECTYELIHIKSDVLDIPKGTVTTVRILGTFEDGYEGSGTSELKNEPVYFKLFKID